MKSSNGDFALKERLLIQYKDKYYPVKKFAVDLSEMTESNKIKYLDKDKKWFLCLKSIFRDHIIMKSQQEGITPSHEFCLILTIKDPSETKNVYDSVSQKLDEYNFWHNNIKLHSDITIHN